MDRPEPTRHRLPKAQRLKGVAATRELFEKGSSVFLYPYKVFFRFGESGPLDGLPQLLVSVPKKRFKRAVHRNAIKRRIREAYRLNKTVLFADKDRVPAAVGLVFVGKEAMPYAPIEKRLKKALALIYQPHKPAHRKDKSQPKPKG